MTQEQLESTRTQRRMATHPWLNTTHTHTIGEHIMNQTEQIYQIWEEASKKIHISIRDIAETEGGHEIYSDGLYYVIEMPDKSCVINSACAKYTHKNIEEFFQKLNDYKMETIE